MHIRPPISSRGHVAPLRLIAAAGALLLATLVTQLPQNPASAAPAAATQPATQALCGPPKPGQFTCFALRRTDLKQPAAVQARGTAQAATPDGYAPTDLRSAYGLPTDERLLPQAVAAAADRAG